MTSDNDQKQNIQLIENLTLDEQHIIETRLLDLQQTKDAEECKKKGIAVLDQLRDIITLKMALLTTLKSDGQPGRLD